MTYPKPILTLWGLVFKEAGEINPEWEYRRSPEARRYIAELNKRIKLSAMAAREKGTK